MPTTNDALETHRQLATDLSDAAAAAKDEGLARPDGSVLITVAARRAGIKMEQVGRFVRTRLHLSDDRNGIIPMSERPPRWSF